MANGDNLVKAPYSMELMTRNIDQFCEEITLDFFTEFEDFLDSSSKDEKSETSVWILLRVPSELGVFVCLFVCCCFGVVVVVGFFVGWLVLITAS